MADISKKSFFVSYNQDNSPYRKLHVPYTSIISNEKGPSILFIAGTHGNEYEGQIILRKLQQAFESNDLTLKKGSIDIIPSLNIIACSNNTSGRFFSRNCT